MQLKKTSQIQIPSNLTGQWNLFKSWVENTQLFHSILNHSGNPLFTIRAHTGDGLMELDLNTNKLTCFEDLPIPLLVNFYINSPFYQNTPDIQNLLEDANKNDT